MGSAYRRIFLLLFIFLFFLGSLFFAKQAFAWVFDFQPPALDRPLNLENYAVITAPVTAIFTCRDGTNPWSSGCKTITYTVTGNLSGALTSGTINNDVNNNDVNNKVEPLTGSAIINPGAGDSFIDIAYSATDYAGNRNPENIGATLHLYLYYYPYKITGYVFIDDNGNGRQEENENTCYDDPISLSLGGTITDNKTFDSQSTCNTYTFNAPLGSYSVSMSPPAGWFVTTSNPISGISLPPDKTDANFGIIDVKAWWQTKLGDVRAGSGSLADPIPTDCTLPSCAPYISLTDGSPGIVSAAVTIDPRPGGSASSPNWQVISNYGGTAYSYNYIKSQIGQSATATSLTDGSSVPTYQGSYGVFKTPDNTDLTISGKWSVSSTQKLIILVERDLIINKEIEVSPGGFLAFFVKRDILVDPSIGGPAANSTQFPLQGIYVADGSFNTGSKSCNSGNDRLNIAGTIVAGSLVRGRCLAREQAKKNPVFYVSYRPDFLLAAPSLIQKTGLVWEEIIP